MFFNSRKSGKRRVRRYVPICIVIILCVLFYTSLSAKKKENNSIKIVEQKECPSNLDQKPLRKGGTVVFASDRPVLDFAHVSCRMTDAGHCFRSTNTLRCLPSFIIGGAQKAATGWLRQRLGNHPLLTQGADKEVHYFDTIQNTNLWQKEYLSWFRADSTQIYTFEKTPDYLPNATSLAMISSLMPSIKLIFLLRNPTSRAYSAFQHHCRRSRIGLVSKKNKVIFQLETSFNEWQKAEPLPAPCLPKHFNLLVRDTYATSRLILWGYYAQDIKNVRRNFPDSQIYIAFSESAFAGNPNYMLADIIRWLGLPSFNFDALPTYTDALGRNQLRKPGIMGLFSLLYLKFNLPMVYSHSTTPMKASTRSFLDSLYRRANRHLDSLLLYEAPSITVFPPRSPHFNNTLLPVSWSR